MLVMELEVVTFALLKNFFSFFLPFLLQDIKVHSLRRDCLWAKLCKQMYKKIFKYLDKKEAEAGWRNVF